MSCISMPLPEDQSKRICRREAGPGRAGRNGRRLFAYLADQRFLFAVQNKCQDENGFTEVSDVLASSLMQESA